MFGEEWTLTKIFNRIQVLNTKKTYSYNFMDRINSKPAIQAGNENLIEYNCFLPLHFQFCNPKKIIEMIEKYAESRQPFEWIYQGEYKGSFLITSIEKIIKNQIKGIILYAEITFNLLENPQEEDFLQQKTGTAVLDEYEQYDSNSSRFKEFSLNVKNSVMETMKEAVNTAVLSDNLSDAAKEILSTVTTDVTSDLTGVNVTEIYNKAEYYADIIQNNNGLNLSDANELASAITSIPGLMLNSALRSAS